MGFLDKVKNMFIEEVEEEEVAIKKEVRQVEIPSPKPAPVKVEKPVTPPVAPTPRPTPVETPVKVPVVEPPKEEVVEQKKEEKFVFPVFEDKDFDMLERKPAEKPVQTRVPIQPKREVYVGKSVEKVEKKIFKPTPIISPVYGVLDKNYRKEDITTKKKIPTVEYHDPSKVNIDDIRKKAYGTLEDDLENTLFGKTSILFNNELEKNDLEKKAALDLLSELEDNDEKDKEIINSLKEIDEKLNSSPKRSDKYPTRETKIEENLVEEELSRDYEEKDIDINDSDLFNLIDSMYEKKDDE